MDFFFFYKAEKMTIPISKFNLLQFFTKLFRFMEICLAVILLSWSFSRLPFAVKTSGEFFGKLFTFIASPLFGFILCNAIIFALVAKPSKLISETETETESETDEFYEEFVKSETDHRPDSLKSENESEKENEEEIVYQDKEMITAVVNTIDREVEVNSAKDSDREDNRKLFMRTLSEKLIRDCLKTKSEKLRRSETEKCRNLDRAAGEKTNEILYYQDDLSNEEFQRKIEAFIAKEKKFRRQESSAIVVHSER